MAASKPRPPKDPTPLQELDILDFAAKCVKYPTVPFEYIVKPQFSDRTTKGLTACIIAWLTHSGHQVKNCDTKGRGNTGSVVTVTIAGRSIRIEIVAPGYDKPASAAAPGTITVSSFAQFHEHYWQLIK